MRALRNTWTSQGATHERQILWAACYTCFHSFLRSSEGTVPSRLAYDPAIHLTMADMSVDTVRIPRMVAVRIKASQTDLLRKGVTIYLDRTHNDLCLVSALLAYIAVRGTEPGRLFRFPDKTPLMRDALVREVLAALLRVGLDPSQYSGHSFRIRAATTAAAAGVEDSVIKTLGR